MSRVLGHPGLEDFNERIKEAMKPIICDAYDEGFRDSQKMNKIETKKTPENMKAFAQGFCEGRDTMWEIARYITTEMTMAQIAEVFGKDVSLMDIFNIESREVLEKISYYQEGNDEEDIDEDGEED